jgi:hypothetical protein
VISANGTRVAFVSEAVDLLADLRDLNQGMDVFAYDVSSGTNLAVTRRAPEMPSLSSIAAPSMAEALSADGRWVAFTSSSPQVIPGQEDSNQAADLFQERHLAASERAVLDVGRGQDAEHVVGAVRRRCQQLDAAALGWRRRSPSRAGRAARSASARHSSA